MQPEGLRIATPRPGNALAVMARTNKGNESRTGLPELARLMVLVLAGWDDRPAAPDEISLWLGSTPRRTRACIALAISRGWVQRKEQGVIVLKAGRTMLTRPPSD
jgi:hypothetical protein